jgi:hypothetical protein
MPGHSNVAIVRSDDHRASWIPADSAGTSSSSNLAFMSSHWSRIPTPVLPQGALSRLSRRSRRRRCVVVVVDDVRRALAAATTTAHALSSNRAVVRIQEELCRVTGGVFFYQPCGMTTETAMTSSRLDPVVNVPIIAPVLGEGGGGAGGGLI